MTEVDVIDVLHAVHEVSERVARIETKLDRYNAVRETAYKAMEISQRNSDTLDEMKTDSKWSKRTAVGAIITMAAKIAYDIFRGLN